MELEKRHDVHVFVDPSVPQIFEDAYAVNSHGTLRILRWSTRREPKRHPIAEFNEGRWLFYRHTGEQGDEVMEPPAMPGKYRDHGELIEAQEERFADVTGVPRGVPHTPDVHAALGHPFDQEARIRDGEQGTFDGMAVRPTTVRPAIPPRGDGKAPASRLLVRPHPLDDEAVTQMLEPLPTSRLPQRSSASMTDGGPSTQLLEPVREEAVTPLRRRGRPARRGTFGQLAWATFLCLAVSVLAAVH
jgi:hypothetical protein